MTVEIIDAMTPEGIKNFLTLCGWNLDKSGTHLTKTGPRHSFRITFKQTCVRIEAKSLVKVPSQWVKIGGSFYKNIKVHDDGRMQIGGDFFKRV